MDKKTQGAWIIHHGKKLQAAISQDFDSLAFAGKAGTLLSAISAEKQAQVPQRKLEALAKASNISPRAELPAIIQELTNQKLVLPGKGAIEVLGLTGYGVLEHTARIFDESSHDAHEDAAIFVAELASENPVSDVHAAGLISDQFKIPISAAKDTLNVGTSIGFFDSEQVSSNEKLLFNGNLFRRDDARKIKAVLSTLKESEVRLLSEVNQNLQQKGCLPLESVTKVIGADLFQKLHSIGLFDVNVVGNNIGRSYFVTRPAAFSKFTHSIADDALDLAKALVASLTYGMTLSSYYRGRIQMISALMNKLISGYSVGPATAIGNDYQALELKGVLEVTPSSGGMFTMRLLKPEVGRLALAVIQTGDITGEPVAGIPGAPVTEYVSPETNREVQRKNATESVKINTRNLLQEIRTGGLRR